MFRNLSVFSCKTLSHTRSNILSPYFRAAVRDGGFWHPWYSFCTLCIWVVHKLRRRDIFGKGWGVRYDLSGVEVEARVWIVWVQLRPDKKSASHVTSQIKSGFFMQLHSM